MVIVCNRSLFNKYGWMAFVCYFENSKGTSMSKRAEQYELDERAKARARITQSPITETTHAHNMGETTTNLPNGSNLDIATRSAVLATIARMQEAQRNELAYLEVMSVLNKQWALMQVKRRFDRSH